jgi:hypothetical protein
MGAAVIAMPDPYIAIKSFDDFNAAAKDVPSISSNISSR